MSTQRPPTRPRRKRPSLRRAVLVMLSVVLLAVAGGTVYALTLGATPSNAAAAPAGSGRHRSPVVRGRIAQIDGDAWTVAPDQGDDVVVQLSADTQFGTQRTPAQRSGFAVGTVVGVVGTCTGDRVAATRIAATHIAATPARHTGTTTAPPATPTPTPTPTPVPSGPDACIVDADLKAAVDEATGQGEQAAVAVLDTGTGTYYSAGEADTPFNTASVVKVFIATDLLLTGQMTGGTATTATTMITQSDDDAADALYGLVGGDDVVTTIGQHYGISDLGSPPADTGQWGETKITANGLAHLYAKLKDDPTVWPWLSHAMADATRDGSDGTDQFFGIPSASNDWAVKQGWMTGLGPGSTYDTTGYVQGDRYAVVILTYGSVAQYGTAMSSTITHMAQDVLPNGQVGGASSASSSCPAS